MYEHLCTGAECPHCSPFGINGPFIDSRGLTVVQQPKCLLPSTTVVIFEDDPSGMILAPWRFVCQQRSDNGYWGFPGGAQEIGESLLTCAIREAYEETGLHVRLLGVACIDSDPLQYGVCSYEDGVVQYTNVTFIAAAHGELRLSCESAAIGWYNQRSMPEPFLPSHQWRFEQTYGKYPPLRLQLEYAMRFPIR